MAVTVQQLVDDVLVEASFDATPAQALRWLSRRHAKMVARSRCFRKTVSIGPTAVDVRDYSLPVDVVEVYSITVAGIPYGKASHVALEQGARGFITLSGDGGVAVGDEDAAGLREVALYPTPMTAGDTIEVRAAFLPPDLVVGTDSTIKIDLDFADALVAGAIATGLRRIEHRGDLAAPHEQEFADGCEELRRRVQRRYRGAGAAQIRIVGVNA